MENILIIDDDLELVKILKLKLQGILSNPLIKDFNNLQSAKDFLTQKESDFDLVIIDQHLPDGLGSDFIKEGFFINSAVLSLSSDDSVEVPEKSISSGANFFLAKTNIASPLFEPLIRGLIQRNKLAKELTEANKKITTLSTIKKMMSTIRHELNNPLAAIIGGLYLLKKSSNITKDEKQALNLIDSSAERIKNVIERMSVANELETTTKSNRELFKVPGDKDWE